MRQVADRVGICPETMSEISPMEFHSAFPVVSQDIVKVPSSGGIA